MAAHRKQIAHWMRAGRSVRKFLSFTDETAEFEDSIRKTGVYTDRRPFLRVLSVKCGQIADERMSYKKRDTPERMSLYPALSREGRLKNRGRPWPREREGPNAVGRDLVFQPSLPAITY